MEGGGLENVFSGERRMKSGKERFLEGVDTPLETMTLSNCDATHTLEPFLKPFFQLSIQTPK